MKKFVALALSFTMALSLAACGSGSSDTQAPADSTAVTDAAADTEAAAGDQLHDAESNVPQIEAIHAELSQQNRKNDGRCLALQCVLLLFPLSRRADAR